MNIQSLCDLSDAAQLYYPIANQRFKGNEQVGHTAAPLFIILSRWTFWLCRDAPLFNELPVHFIQADHRTQRIIRTLVYIRKRKIDLNSFPALPSTTIGPHKLQYTVFFKPFDFYGLQ